MWKQLVAHAWTDRSRFRTYRDKWINEHEDEWRKTCQIIEKFNQTTVKTDRPVNEVTFTLFDIETTGFYVSLGDEILSIGALYHEAGKSYVNNTFYSLIYSVKPVPDSITALTGLTSKEAKMGEDFPIVLRKFLQFSNGTVLVAHPAGFDIPFLQAMCKRWKLPVFEPAVLDSINLAKLLYPGADNSLDRLLQRYHMPVIERHHALNDAVITAEVFQNLLQAAEEKGYSLLSELMEECSQAGAKRRRK